jgi:hypothetical protein
MTKAPGLRSPSGLRRKRARAFKGPSKRRLEESARAHHALGWVRPAPIPARNFRTHQHASQGRGGAVSCRAWRLPTELRGSRATIVDAFRSLMKVRVGRGFDPIHDRITGCSENPPKRGLRNPITAAIGQSKNRCSEYTDSRNTRRGPTRRRRVRCRRASRRPTLPEVGNWRLSAPKNKGPPSPPEASH